MDGSTHYFITRLPKGDYPIKRCVLVFVGRYIDVNGRLKAEYTIEGVHITEEGYRSIFDEIVRYVME